MFYSEKGTNPDSMNGTERDQVLHTREGLVLSNLILVSKYLLFFHLSALLLPIYFCYGRIAAHTATKSSLSISVLDCSQSSIFP